MSKPHHSLIGIGIFTSLLIGGVAISFLHTYLHNLEGFIVLIAGTLGAIFISYPFNSLQVAIVVAFNTYRSRVPSAQEIVDSLLQLSMQSRMEGVLALETDGERVSVLFLKRALTMLVDGFNADELREALHVEIHFFQKRRIMHERVFRQFAKLIIAFGFLGGLVGLAGLSQSFDLINLSHNILIIIAPLVTGVTVAYFLFIPIAENIHAKTQEELLIHKLIAEGVILIAQEYNILKLQTRLQSFITPRDRDIQHMSVKEIRDRYEDIKNSRLDR